MPYTNVKVAAAEGDRVVLVFYDPSGSVKEVGDSVIGQEDIRSYAVAKLAALNRREGKKSQVVVGQDIDLTPPTPAALTLKEAWDRDSALVEEDARAKRLGIEVDTASATSHRDIAQASWDAWQAAK